MANNYSPRAISLNSVKYPLAGDGQIHPILLPYFAQKQVTGDFTKDSDPERSTWVIVGDNTGGIGVENMTSLDKQGTRTWYNSGLSEYPGHFTLRRLQNTVALPSIPAITNGSMETWTDSTNLTSWSKTGTLAQGTGTDKDAGTYAAKLGAAGVASSLYQTIGTGLTAIASKVVWVTFRYKSLLVGASTPTVDIYDGVAVTTSSKLTSTSWATGEIVHVIDSTAVNGPIVLTFTTGTDAVIDIDSVETSVFTTSIPGPTCVFNNNTYFAVGNILLQVANSTGALSWLGTFPATITDLIPSLGDTLFIFLGDADYYWLMSTSNVFTQTSTAGGLNATKGIHWDGKLFKMSSAGVTYKSTTAAAVGATPDATTDWNTPTWTCTLVPASQGTVTNLVTYADASGDDIIYAGTTMGLAALDYTNAIWLNTELQVPLHADNGKGLAVQSGSLWYSAGLMVAEYSFNSGYLSINYQRGLDRNDGLPDDYVGSIVKLIGGYGGKLYALVDAQLIAAANYSGVYEFNGIGWHVIDLLASTEKAYSGIVSSTYAYRLWDLFGVSGLAPTVGYISLDRARRNPLKTTTSYAVSSVLHSPWFDSGWPGTKTALAVKVFASGLSATEIVYVYYRINHTYTDLSTGWTLLATMVAAQSGAEQVYTFASGVGLAFKSIQFRVNLGRTTATATPDVQYMILEYDRVPSTKWSWAFSVDCSSPYDNKTPSQLISALETAASSEVLVPFIYYNTTKYVRVKTVQATRESGKTQKGVYDIMLVEK